VFQWEASRRWDLDGTSEFCRADNALLVPGGFSSISVFFRRVSQTADTFTLTLWTAPLWTRLLDDEITASNAAASLLSLEVQPSNGLSMTGTGAQVFGARIDPSQAMGSLLFWQVAKTSGAGLLVGDLYLVPNHAGSMTSPRFGRTVNGPSNEGPTHAARRAARDD